jgi:hypothetical protein
MGEPARTASPIKPPADPSPAMFVPEAQPPSPSPQRFPLQCRCGLACLPKRVSGNILAGSDTKRPAKPLNKMALIDEPDFRCN